MKRKSSGIKPKSVADSTEIVYSEHQWKLLSGLRDVAFELMEGLTTKGIQPLIYGSVCRGDVSKTSDIDLFIPYQISSFKVELAIEQLGKNIYAKKIVQATPKHLVKANIFLSEDICLTFPLTSIREREYDFIQFGGSMTFDDLKANKRVPGVDKRLLLIEPNERGHTESPVVGYESIIADIIGVSVGLVKERVRILTTRDKVGRTGVYLDMNLSNEENIEEVFKSLKDKDPIIRRRAKL